MKEIGLAGKYRHLSLVIDDVDLDLVQRYSWIYTKVGGSTTLVYARRIWVEDGKYRQQYLHTFLTGWKLVDHVNHDGLDNRRGNLREASHKQNMRNSRKRVSQHGKPCTSVYKGVGRSNKTFEARITVDGERFFLGRFREERDAARAYDAAAKIHFGEYAYLNFPEESS